MLVPWFTVVASAATGPFAVGWQDREFDDPVAGTVRIRVYYPALAEGEAIPGDVASGPFPLAAFMHGWLGSAWMYDGVCNDLASWGYVVASLDTETGLILDMDDFADDAVAMLHAVESRSAVPSDLLAGLVSDDDWTALGHSMGGATLGKLLGLEPKIRTAVAFMPYEGDPAYYDAVRGYDGSLLVLSGTNDTTAPPALQQEWMEAADTTARSLLIQIADMGHQAVTDLSFDDDPMPDDLQLEIVSALATTFVRAEQRGEEALWIDLVGPAAPEIERTLWSRSHDPALWATLADDRVSLGVAGLSASTGEVILGSDEALTDGISVGTLDLALGVAELTVDVPASMSGDLWVGVRTDGADGEVWTRSVGLVVGSEPDPEDPGTPGEPPDEDEGEDGSPDDAGSDDRGCSTAPGVGLPWLLLLLLRRRRG